MGRSFSHWVGCVRSLPRGVRQTIVREWGSAAFGDDQMSSVPQRCVRLFEEVAETCQAGGADLAQLHRLIDFVYARPAGDLRQEIGGVGVCLLALAAAADISADDAEVDEIERVLAKPIEHFTARNQAKNDAGFKA